MQALLLAAGHGKRAGGPKAWQVRDGKTLLERQLAFLLSRFAPADVHVSIQAAWLDRCRALAPVDWVPVDPDLPAFDSLLALREKAKRDWSSVHHVDMPVWEPALWDALKPADCDAVVPAFEGRRGHPVLLAPRADLSKHSRLDEWLRQATVLTVDVPFACVRENWNVVE